MQKYSHLKYLPLEYFSNGWRIVNAINELEKVKKREKISYALKDFYEHVGKYIAYSVYHDKKREDIDLIKDSGKICFINDLIWPDFEDWIYHKDRKEILKKIEEIARTSITTIEKVLAEQEVTEEVVNSTIDYFQELSSRCLSPRTGCWPY